MKNNLFRRLIKFQISKMNLTYFTFILAVIYAKKTMGAGMTNVRAARIALHHVSTVAAGSTLHPKSSQGIKYKPKKHLKDGEAIFIMCLVVFIFSYLFISPLIKGY